MGKEIISEKAPDPLGVYPHARKVGNLLFLSGVGPRKKGSDEIPGVLKERYKTVWELKQRHIIDMAKDRGKYICQSQSMNLFLESPDISTMTSMHFYSWKQGLKTGIYYLRSRPSSKAIQFTVKPQECESCSA